MIAIRIVKNSKTKLRITATSNASYSALLVLTWEVSSFDSVMTALAHFDSGRKGTKFTVVVASMLLANWLA